VCSRANLPDPSLKGVWLETSCQLRAFRAGVTCAISQKCAAVPRRARIQGSQTFVSLNSRLESNKEEEEEEEG